MHNDSSNNTERDEEEDCDDEEEEEGYYDKHMERELQARFIEYGHYEAKEGNSSMGKLEGKTKGWDRVGASIKDWLWTCIRCKVKFEKLLLKYVLEF